MRQVVWVYSALKYFVQAKSTNYTRICVKTLTKIFSLIPVLKATVLFQSRQFEQLYICISISKFISFSCRVSISRVISIHKWDTFLGHLLAVKGSSVLLF